ncbi:MAG TPA: hypothetical protein PKD72_04935 [Gemmatales bacterium]|nr:hypothetical protein [Gemmatales bacterium]
MLPLLLLFSTIDSPAEEMDKLLPAIKTGITSYAKEARNISGSMLIYSLGESKKLLRGQSVKSDATRYLVQTLNAQQQPTQVELYRRFDDIRHAIHLVRTRNGIMMRQDEQFRRPGEPEFDIDNPEIFAFDSPNCMALRPVPSLKFTLPMLLEYPAFEVTKIEPVTINNIQAVKITYQVNETKNAQADPGDKLTGLVSGSVTLHPGKHYTVLQAEYTLPAERRTPSRSWKADYVYVASEGPFQVLQEIQLATTDQQPDSPDLKLQQTVYEFTMKPNTEAWSDKDFSMEQFGMKEHTAQDWLAEMAQKEKEEAEEKAKIAALPPGATKPISEGLRISPWAILYGGIAGFILLVLWVIWITSKPRKTSAA